MAQSCLLPCPTVSSNIPGMFFFLNLIVQLIITEVNYWILTFMGLHSCASAKKQVNSVCKNAISFKNNGFGSSQEVETLSVLSVEAWSGKSGQKMHSGSLKVAQCSGILIGKEHEYIGLRLLNFFSLYLETLWKAKNKLLSCTHSHMLLTSQQLCLVADVAKPRINSWSV